MKIDRYRDLRPKITAEDQDKKLQDVSRMYEKQFLREIVKSMRGTTTGKGLVPESYGEKIFKDQLDHEYVEKWGDNGGIGLSKLIYDQMLEKYGAQLGLRVPNAPIRGPVSLQKTDRGLAFKVEPPKSFAIEPTTAQIERQKIEAERSVVSPWYGKVVRQQSFDADNTLLEILHDKGMVSQFVFRGKSAPDLLGKEVTEGEKLGLMSPDATTLYWNFHFTEQGPGGKIE